MVPRRLSHRVYDQLLRLLPRLYAATTVAELKALVPHLAVRIVEADGAAWFEFKFAESPEVMSVDESTRVVTPDRLRRIPAAIASHPFSEVWFKTPDRPALKMSDVPSKKRNRYLDEHREAYDGVGREQMNLPIVLNPRRVTMLSYRRERTPFKDEDLLALEVLAPHLRQALANAIAFERYEALKASAVPSPAAAQLTPRETEVGFWLSQGKTNLEIGVILKMATRTAEKHVESILRKLHVENRTAAAMTLRAIVRSGIAALLFAT